MNGQEPSGTPPEAAAVQRGNESRLAILRSSIGLSERVQFGLIALAYALVLGHWMFAIHLDNVWSAADPADDMRSLAVDFSHLLHACSLMIPTLWLILLTAKFERVYTAYSRFLFWLSVTLPVLMAVCVASPSLFADALVARLMVTPFILVGMAFSRWMARSDLSKRLTFRALVIEGAAFGASVALFLTGVL